MKKMSEFVSFPFFGFTLVIKLSSFDFQKLLKYFSIFDKNRYGIRFECLMKKCLILFNFHCLGFIKLRNFDFEGH